MPNNRRVSNEWILGVTAGGYITFSVALYCFGQGLIPPGYPNDVPMPYSMDPHALFFLVPGILACSLSFLQIYFEKLFTRKLPERTTRYALGLNAVGAVGLCGAVLKDAPGLEVFAMFLVAIGFTCFLIGIVVSISNLVGSIFRKQAA
jgi:tellurite resistance protein TehA-like permease